MAKKSARLRDVVARCKEIEDTLCNECKDGALFDNRLLSRPARRGGPDAYLLWIPFDAGAHVKAGF